MRKIIFFVMLALMVNIASAFLYTTTVKPEISTTFNETLNASSLVSNLTFFMNPNLFIGLTLSTTDNRTFRWTPIPPLDNGWYFFSSNARDIVGNSQTYTDYVLVNATELKIRWSSPRVGVFNFSPSTSNKANAVLTSTLTATCAYSYTQNGTWTQFTTTGGTTHSILFDSILKGPRDFYVNCTDSVNNRTKITKLHIGWDDQPTQINAYAIPSNVGLVPPQTELVVTSSKPVVCRSDNVFSSNAFFDGNNLDDYDSYLIENNKTVYYPNTTNPTSYVHNILCTNWAQFSSFKTINVSVSPNTLNIVVLNPPQYTPNRTGIFVNVTTNQQASCSYGINAGANASTCMSSCASPDYVHTAVISSANLGSNTLYFECFSSQKQQSASYTFISDNTPPNGTMNVTMCKTDHMDLIFNVSDNESGIGHYEYNITGGGNFSVSGTSTSTPVTITGLNLSFNNSPYTVSAKAFNKAGVFNQFIVAKSFNPNASPECWEKNPPVVTLKQNVTSQGVEVTLNCTDDSGCDPAKIYKGISSVTSACNASTSLTSPYKTLLSQTSKFCWEAWDIFNNVARGSQIITVGTISTGCSNGVRDGNETGVDCGGGCPGCSEGSNCTQHSDCSSNYCVAGICTASTCTDLIKNGYETDVDCGGSCITKCGLNKACGLNTDCSSNYCSSGICLAASCTDGIKNGDEGDRDCGGSCPTRCSEGSSCIVSGDCASNNCAAGRCVKLSDDDRWQKCAADHNIDANDRTGDADSDGISNYNECVTSNTDPKKADTDGDGYSDGYETKAGTNPNDPNDHPSTKFWNWLLFVLGFLLLIAGIYLTYVQKKEKKLGQSLLIVGGAAALLFMIDFLLISFNIAIPAFIPAIFLLGTLGGAGYFGYKRFGKAVKAPAAVPGRPVMVQPRAPVQPPTRLAPEEEKASRVMVEMMRKQQLEAEEARRKVFEKFGPAPAAQAKPAEAKPAAIAKPKEVIPPPKAAMPDEFAKLSEIVEKKGEFGKLESLGRKTKAKEEEFTKLEALTKGTEEKGLERLKPKERKGSAIKELKKGSRKR